MIGYARVSRFGTDAQEQRAALLGLGVAAERVYLDVGLTGMTRPRAGLREALAATRGGDTLVVTALARLARSVPDAAELLDRLAAGGTTLVVGDGLYPPFGPGARVLGETLAVTAHWHAGVASRRTRSGVAAARRRGQLRGRATKLTDYQERHVVGLYWTGRYTVSEIGELFDVSRSTVYRAVRRAAQTPASVGAAVTSGQLSSRPTL